MLFPIWTGAGGRGDEGREGRRDCRTQREKTEEAEHPLGQEERQKEGQRQQRDGRQSEERDSMLPSRRHCRRMPPDDMFFSASISVKLRELAKISTSTRLTRRCRKVTEASTLRPCEGSMLSSSCCDTRGEEEEEGGGI